MTPPTASPRRERQAAILLASGLVLLLTLGLTMCLTTDREAVVNYRQIDALGPSPRVRVRLLRRDGADVTVTAAGGIRLVAAGGDTQDLGERCTIRAEEGGLLFDGSIQPRTTRLVGRGDAPLRIDDVAYPGSLRVVPDERRGHVFVLEVPLETYVACVLPREMPLGSAASALRAQAIATRSYVVATMLARRDRNWDVVDTEASQVFGGLDRNVARGRLHVDATRGLVLAEGNEVLRSYFSATCGGHTRSNARAFGEAARPALEGAPCGYCDGHSEYRWSLTLPRRAGLGFLPTEAFIEGEIADDSLLVLRGSGGREARLGPRDLRRLAAPRRLKSTRWLDVEITSNAIVVQGAGFGHRVGLCQNGARAMGRAGRGAAQILAHYYPGAEIVRLRP